MKTSIEHLPENKRAELLQLASLVRQHTDDIAMIILFGSYARGEYKEEKDLLPERKSGHASDYDILVVTAKRDTADDSKLWKTVNDRCHAQQFSAVPRLIVHDIQDINIKLAQAHYFYTEIIESGYFLFNSEKFTLTEKRSLLPNEYKRLSEEYFDSGFRSAKGFLTAYQAVFKVNEYKNAAFQLNQATESAYKTVLLVFTHYAPHEHYLTYLAHSVEEIVPSFGSVFPQNTKQQREQFNLLDYAYIGARYDPTFKINKGDLESLAECIENLLKLTEKVCKAKIQSFA